MSYIQNTLLKNEKVIFTTRRHWIIFFLPLCFTLAGWFFWQEESLLTLLGYLFFFIAIYYWLSALTCFLTSEYAVTNKRVLIKLGFVQRQSWETLLPKIAGLEVKQNLFGRILGYGTLIVQSTGGNKDIFNVISDPMLFRRKIQEQAELMQVNLSAPPAQPSSTNTVTPNEAKLEPSEASNLTKKQNETESIEKREHL